MANRRYNTQVAQPRGTDRVKRAGGGMGGRSGPMMYSRGQGVNMRSKRVPTELMDRGAMKKGGKVLKPVPAGKKGLSKLPTDVRNKMGFMKSGGRVNTKRMNKLEELGRVDAEKADTKKGKRNLKDEKKRIVRELKKKINIFGINLNRKKKK